MWCERQWNGCTVAAEEQEGIWYIAVRVGPGTKPQWSFLSVRMASRAPASCEHPSSHSMCNAESRAGELSQDTLLCWAWTLKCHTIGVRLSRIIQAMHWHALEIWPSFMHSKYKIYRFQSHLHGITSFHQLYSGLVILQLSAKDRSKYIQKCKGKSCVLPPHTKSWIISKSCTSGENSYGLQSWSPVREWLIYD